MPKTQAYVTKEQGTKVESMIVDMPEVGPNDVKVELLCSGVCSSDVSMVQNFWGVTKYPMVAGHEGIGKVVEVGANVKNRKVGDTVGLGWMRESCGACRCCMSARENLCPDMLGNSVAIFNTCQGTFAEFCVSPEKYACPIPETLDPVTAAPLMCAGITVWNPLVTHANSMSRVGVNAIGGLGHLAVQFAAKMGMEVVAMNRGMKKKDAALALGATRYVDTKDAAQMADLQGTLDLLLDCAPVTADMSALLPLLGPAGKYVTVGVTHDGKKLEFQNSNILGQDNSVVGSTYGSLSQLQDMFIFCSRHNITADCEVMPMSELSEALDKNDRGDMTRLRLTVVRQEKLDALKNPQDAGLCMPCSA